MPLQEAIDTYSYFITEADKLNLSYITLLRYHPFLDFEYDGTSARNQVPRFRILTNTTFLSGVKRATRHDVLETYSPYFKNTKLILNAGVLPEEGEELVASGKVDAISIGTNWIAHPDLAKRVEHGKPLDNVLDTKRLYTNAGDDDWAKGYTDYPVAAH